jgi:hypothetical protein
MTQTVVPTQYHEIVSRMDELTQIMQEMRAALYQLVSEISHPLPDWIKPITKDDEWFWSEEWQAKERIVDEHIARGEVVSFDSIEDFIADLHKAA